MFLSTFILTHIIGEIKFVEREIRRVLHSELYIDVCIEPKIYFNKNITLRQKLVMVLTFTITIDS